MNIGDGLLFALENGKPKLILLSHGVEKTSAKLPHRPRPANVLSSRQPSCVEEVQRGERPARQEAGRCREPKNKRGVTAPSFGFSGGRRSAALTSSKTHEQHKGGGVKAAMKERSDGHKRGRTGPTQKPGASGDTEPRNGRVSPTEQLQQILRSVQSSSGGLDRPEDHGTQDVGVTLKQQPLAPSRLQVEEDSDSVFSVRSSFIPRTDPAAVRSSLRLGDVVPMEEVLGQVKREEQRRRWLEELDKQREDTAHRRTREKLLQSQTVDHELWTTHFDSLQRRPPVQTTAPSAPPVGPSERGDGGPSPSRSLVWEAMSSCGGENVGGVSVDTTGGLRTVSSHLRTMTALLDPAQIEEREKRRLKQQEQQRVFEAQVEERRQQRALERMRRRVEEEQEETKLGQEREMLKGRHERDTLKERQSEQQSLQGEEPDSDGGHQETGELPETGQEESVEEVSRSASTFRDTAVQTEEAPSLLPAADRLQTPPLSAQQQPPPLSAPLPTSRNRALRTGKENICLPGGGGGGGGGDPYEAFARTERRRPEWNTQRPSRQFVPASQRYPVSLQRDRQESRMKRQEELLALQERCLSRVNPPPPPPLQHQELHLCSNPSQSRTGTTRKVESVLRGPVSADRGRSLLVPAVRVQSEAQPSSTPPLSPPPALDFIPYVRTDEVLNLDPQGPAGYPPPHSHTEAHVQAPQPHRDPLLHPEPQKNTPTQRQQEILRGLAQLRQGLLQKQRELERDLNPLLRRHDTDLR